MNKNKFKQFSASKSYLIDHAYSITCWAFLPEAVIVVGHSRYIADTFPFEHLLRLTKPSR